MQEPPLAVGGSILLHYGLGNSGGPDERIFRSLLVGPTMNPETKKDEKKK
jgi:hypothetical protein